MNNQSEVTIYGRLGKKPELRLTKKRNLFVFLLLPSKLMELRLLAGITL